MKNDNDATVSPCKEIVLQHRWIYEFASHLPEYDALPCPTVNDGATLITQPPTPALPSHLVYDGEFSLRLEEAFLKKMQTDDELWAQCVDWINSLDSDDSPSEDECLDPERVEGEEAACIGGMTLGHSPLDRGKGQGLSEGNNESTIARPLKRKAGSSQDLPNKRTALAV